MKNVLLATTALVMSAGFAAAEVTLSGDARMGLISDFGSDYVQFTSRARVSFTLSGESDSGFSFGASFRADNATAVDDGSDHDDGASTGNTEMNAGTVFISGAFGTLTMGDVDTAAKAMVGNVDGVGLTGLGDLNEIWFMGQDDDTSVLYTYAAGDLTLAASMDQNDSYRVFSLGAKYVMGDYAFSLGYENAPDDCCGWNNIAVGADATFGAVTAKIRYNRESYDGSDYSNLALSATYTMDQLSVTGFTTTFTDSDGDNYNHYGLGASYDLGGGASLVGGVARDVDDEESAWDLGLSFSF